MRVTPAVPLIVLLTLAAPVHAQSPSSAAGAIYRVFLTTGDPLPSYGEPAFVGDRVIFNLVVGAVGEASGLQLVSLPSSRVDLERTSGYVHAVRATQYGATRGETDYAALTAEVARVLDQLTTIGDARRRLALAEGARRQLLAWLDDHYHYRASDIRELAGLFDGVIAELRVAAGLPGVSFELIARPPPPDPLLPAPTARETVALALAAARAADVGSERVDILRRASDAAGGIGDPDVARTVDAALGVEVKIGRAYATLLAAMHTRLEAARRRGDVVSVERIGRELDRQDRALGQRRPSDVQAFNARLSATLEETRQFRRALDAHARQLSAMRVYDRRVRPLLDRFERLESVLDPVRERRGVTPRQLDRADAEFQQIARELAAVKPPAAQNGAHATFQSALRLAREACARRRQATSSQSPEMSEASAAASGAMLLGAQVRRDLTASLRRPVLE